MIIILDINQLTMQTLNFRQQLHDGSPADTTKRKVDYNVKTTGLVVEAEGSGDEKMKLKIQ